MLRRHWDPTGSHSVAAAGVISQTQGQGSGSG
ncbi:hypothetical protein CYB_0365 [Synechococcus sp. JA-2-3B'a(2-13)]|nr:hypothetical protein CYB_0365 [Synechococcus sp. JA-2-3B'a(2-13)]